GTGIGLAMTRKIIEYFGGRIWLDTTFTGGTRFCFTLPMPQETMMPELPEPSEGLEAPADPEDRQDEETDGRLR
ncbi:MAG TPA: ATP-binding protein, partial [Streptosporangiaceae bacterium]|nr:ATP-binding protein [Streptosporangiaceae bacterium]